MFTIFFITTRNTNRLEKKRHFIFIYIFIVALLSFPGVNFSGLIHFFFINVLPKLLELQSTFPRNELSFLILAAFYKELH